MLRRRGIPECILLVTQRITKYPVLLERILQYTQGESSAAIYWQTVQHHQSSQSFICFFFHLSENTEECADLSKALARIKEVVAAVDLKVSVYERHQKLQDVWSRMENRSSAKLKNGHTFRKQDMMGSGQTLKHQGVLLWKTATGRLKGDNDAHWCQSRAGFWKLAAVVLSTNYCICGRSHFSLQY